ncbi:(2Fe-2S)-binding protein [Pseudonocardia humida]|uniref:(2Fe-2S)-binding protein n=1 Tax=Pseudonocardia humida TaxID=2800819 RepID=A0ABT1A0V4_9PSEU|nr:(2Fe-2S)-binding protein [Pseudonocardia humida]MCO1656540.1 (2Fe-2S)-binding protein [Pseudonocardia humida]
MDVRAVLADVAALGPFFTVRTGDAESADPTWQPLSAMETDGPPLRRRIAHVRRALGGDDAVEPRVAASIAFQGVVGVIVSPAFGAAVLHGVVPSLDPAELHWRDSATGPLPLWAPAPTGAPAPDAPAAAAALGELYDAHLPALVAAVRGVAAVSPRVLWGNVASVVAGTTRMVTTARPAAARRAAEVGALLLDRGRLAGSGVREAPRPPDVHWTFRRRSCCLFYRVPGGGYCGDCVLAGA